jgi:hypothetical protein
VAAILEEQPLPAFEISRNGDGTDGIWWILEGHDYPRLWCELIAEN